LILDHNFGTRNARKSIKGSKDSDSSLVSNENFSETLWPSGWAPDSLLDCTRKKFFGWGWRFFVSDVISEVVFVSFWLMLPGLGPNC